jgi:hypothetical protein
MDHMNSVTLLTSSSSMRRIQARMRVPKMAKNGQNSHLHVSAGFDKDTCPKNSRTDMNSKTALKSQMANKNHFRPISEQAYALVVTVRGRDPQFSGEETAILSRSYLQAFQGGPIPSTPSARSSYAESVFHQRKANFGEPDAY